MDKSHYDEMVLNLNKLIQNKAVQKKKIYLFGHCNATEELADLLLDKGFQVVAILDNNTAKHGREYRGILIKGPQAILSDKAEQTLVCIVARAFAAMQNQLKTLGYTGRIEKLVDYNSYAEYVLSEEALTRKKKRVERGLAVLQILKQRYPDNFRILCPFAALGDVYFTMSYLPYFIQNRNITECVIVVIGEVCAEVVRIFGRYKVEVLSQKNMDEMVQAVLFFNDSNSFISHQDRPYVINLSKALYVKCVPLEKIYCCGVFGLPASTEPYQPIYLQKYHNLEQIKEGNSVIFSPYAKSVTALPEHFWNGIVSRYQDRGYQCFTNIVGEEKPLEGTCGISLAIAEIQSAVEHAGTFIGIRSGLCDVLRDACARKIVFYPDYNYCDTGWKAIDMYRIEGWENIVVKDDGQWERR